MKIQISSKLDKDFVETHIQDAEIVDYGDYLLVPNATKIIVEDAFEKRVVDVLDVYFVFIEQGKTLVKTQTKTYRSIKTLSELESDILFRINKSTLINLDCVEDIKVKLNMKYALKIGELWFDVNRTYYNAFKERLGL